MPSTKKLLEAAAGNAGGAGLDIAEVFSTYLYTGNGGTQTITNDIDLSGEGGLVWIKDRNYGNNHFLWDTNRGVQKGMITSTTLAQQNEPNGLTAFNSNGFSVGSSNGVNPNTYKIASWTFRKAEKFFDVVTYTGTGVAGRTVSHNLGSVPGMILLKRTDSSSGWRVYHRGANGGTNPQQYYAMIQATNAFATASTVWNNTAPTDSVFTLGTDTDSNTNNATYVAYLFAHNNNDGGFGPDADQDIIKCGSISGFNGRADLGFEPQWVLLKLSNSTSNWILLDVMRQWTPVNENDDEHLYANTSSTEQNYSGPSFDATGFNYGQSGEDWVYIAIRAPMMAEPAAATDVFAIATRDATAPGFNSGFPVDATLQRSVNTADNPWLSSRLTGTGYLQTTRNNPESTSSSIQYDFSDGYGSAGTATSLYGWMWKRAKGYFDVVTYTGTGANRTVAHSLGVAPEMMWIKNRGTAIAWAVYHKDLGNAKALFLNDDQAEFSNTSIWNSTTPTDTNFTLGTYGNAVNQSSKDFIAYLFATLAGISKVGSVSHSGSSTDVNCGFSNGSRFVMLKRTDGQGGWYYWDSARGIIAGNDPYLLLNTTAAQVTNTDYIDPLSSGFTITGDFTDGAYIFYAIA